MKNLLFLLCVVALNSTDAQNAETLINDITNINNTIVKNNCSGGNGNTISNRAMNIFLAHQLASYFSGTDDLSLYKNAVTFNSSEGNFAVLHNLRQASGADVPISSSLFIGAKANILHSLLSTIANQHNVNDFVLVLKQVWMGKTASRSKNGETQKIAMDAHRAGILHSLEAEIKQRSTEFENSLLAIKATEVPDQNMDSVKTILRQHFYNNLKEEYHEKFASKQAEALIVTKNYQLITTSWTSINVYLPVLLEKYDVAPTFTQRFKGELLFPVNISLTHTRFWQSPQLGRMFFKLNAGVFAANTIISNEVRSTSSAEYKANGGSDTGAVNKQNSNQLFIGPYHNFLNSFLNAGFIYFPPDSHIGLSASIEKNVGRYKSLNGKIGLPIVLIDQQQHPTFTFEFQVLFNDLTSNIQPTVQSGDKVAIGFTLGIPFSKIVF